MKKSKMKSIALTLLTVFFIWPAASLMSILFSGITPATSKQGWYSFDIVFIMFWIHLIYWIFFMILALYRMLFEKTLWVINIFLIALTFPLFFGGLALNWIRPSLPDWKWLIPFIFMYPLASAMPFINQKASDFLNKEIFAPKTKLGRNLLWLLPSLGVSGAALSRMVRTLGDGLVGFAIFGMLLNLLLVWTTASFAQQIWESWQREKLKQKEQSINA